MTLLKNLYYRISNKKYYKRIKLLKVLINKIPASEMDIIFQYTELRKFLIYNYGVEYRYAEDLIGELTKAKLAEINLSNYFINLTEKGKSVKNDYSLLYQYFKPKEKETKNNKSIWQTKTGLFIWDISVIVVGGLILTFLIWVLSLLYNLIIQNY